MAPAPETVEIARIEEILGEEAADLLDPRVHHDQPRSPGSYRGRTSSTGSCSSRTARSACLRAIQTLSATAGWAAPGTCRSCPSTRASNTPPARRSPRTPTTSIPPRSSSWRSRAAATPWPRRWARSGITARRYAHRIPFLLKLNHNEFLSYPNAFDQIMFASVRQAWEMGCVAVGATIYFGSPESKRQIQEVSEAFEAAHDLGMATVLWCYTRNADFNRTKDGGPDYHTSDRPDRPGQPPGRHDRGGHHQAEAARDPGGRLQGPRVRQVRRADVQRADERRTRST